MMNREIEKLDSEWLALIIEAKNIGISKEAVRNFLHERQVKELVTENT
jgi:antagonist of SinR